MNKRNGLTCQRQATLLYGFLFGYVLSFIFAGKVYEQVAEMLGHVGGDATILAMVGHMIGLIMAGAFLKKPRQIISGMKSSLILCIFLTPLFLVPWEWLSILIYAVLALLSGVAVACWGLYYKECIEAKQRLQAMADVLILSNT